MLIAIPVLLYLQAEPTMPIKASNLKNVNGPTPPKYHDPARGIDSDRSSLKLRRSARRSKITTVQVPTNTKAIVDKITDYSGWKAYQIEAGPKSTVKMDLVSDHITWFTINTVNKWGQTGPGMLQNITYKGKPTASYINSKNEVSTVYFIVDTNQATPQSEEYTLHITWD